MGIQNLLRFLKPFIHPVHIRKYSGQRVGIDAYSWLHKGAYSCSMELCLNLPGEAAKRYLRYFMHRLNLLKHYEVIPVVVFDGGNMPCKSATELERRSRREANLRMAKEKMDKGDVTGAIDFFQKAISITPSMAHQLIQILRAECIEFIVAPYEADAQLAYLSTVHPDQGGITAVITEDSDLIAYGCQAVIFKMDRFGNGEEFLMDTFFHTVHDGLSFKEFNKEMITGMCVLSGCDFLPSIHGIGTKRAYSLISKYKDLDHVLSVLKLDKRYKMPEDYAESFRKIIAIFHHARVYDVVTQALTHLKPLEEKHLGYLDGDLQLLGPDLPSPVAAAIAEGHLNPITMQPFVCLPKGETVPKSFSISTFSCANKDESAMSPADESFVTTTEHAYDNSIEVLIVSRKDDLEKKHMREASALRRLVVSEKHQEITKTEVSKRLMPNNNPFKKRKLERSDVEKRTCDTEQSVLTQNFSPVLCSSPESQESVASKPKKSFGKENLEKCKTKIENKCAQGEKVGILKFFQRL